MGDFRAEYMGRMKTLHSLYVPSVHRVIGTLLISAILLTLAMLWFVPWVQTAYGEGEVNTPDPNARIQAISALVSGQVEEWHVTEGQSVKAGDPIVTIVDADPELIQRIENQIAASLEQKKAQEAALATQENNLERQKRLEKDGLASRRDIEQISVSMQKIRAEIAKIDAEINRLKVTKARESLRTKIAPKDGTILRLLSSGTATYVKPGDVLASFIPNDTERYVVIRIRGLDASLVTPGRQVRIQFDGLPVIQFSGWPEMAVGTFGGLVDFVEPVASASGQFNVWVKPDPDAEHPWPSKQFIRLGSRVRAWVLLEEVRLGYELWRQLNQFPPRPTDQVSQQ